MATTVGQHSVATFTSPVNGTTPIDANSVRGNDNTLRTSYVDHDADPGIHVQSSTLASRPVAGTAGRKWITEDSGSYTLWFDDGTNWNAVSENSTLAEVLASGNTTGSTDIVVSAGQKIRTPLVAAQDGTSAITLADSTGALTLHTALADTNLATIATAGKVSNSATTATSANTASAIVSRDASGNFTAGTVTAALSGNASTATALQTARTINGTSFDGTANITVTAAAGTLTGTTLASNVVTSSLTSVGTLANLTVTNPITGSVTGSSGSTTGNAATATALQTARTINGTSFDGTANITVTAAAGTLTGTTLNGTVVSSSLTSVGTIGTGVWQGTAISDTYLATISTAGKVSNSATTATSANTASAIVARDASGNFTAGTITATLSGAAPAGSLSGTTLASNVVSSSLTSVGTLANLTVTNPISGSVTGSSGSTTGNAATATALQTARAINGVNFDGSADITVTAAAGTLSGSTLASGVTASSLTSVGTLSSLTVNGAATLGNNSALQWRNSAGTPYRFILLTASNTLQVGDVDNQGYPLLLRAGTGADMQFYANNAEGMRLTSTGLGIGTISPVKKIDVTVATGATLATSDDGLRVSNALARAQLGVTGSSYTYGGASADSALLYSLNRLNIMADSASPITFHTGTASPTEKMHLNASGNLGLGVTPSAWGSSYKALDIGGGASIAGLSNNTYITTNAYDNGSNYIYKATAAATLYLSTAGQHRWYTAASGTAGNAITFTQAMTLDASGNLGIGTSSPATKLAVNGGTSTTEIRIDNTDNSKSITLGLATGGVNRASIAVATSSSDLVIKSEDAGGRSNGIQFWTGNTSAERARITSGGYFKASNTGTYANSTGSFHELRTDASDPVYIYNTHATTPNGIFLNYTVGAPDNNTQYFLLCNDAVTARCYIWSDGDLANHDGVYGTISDERLKQDITDAGSQWDDLKAVRFRKYRMKTDVVADANAPYQLGVIAQEIEQTSPGLVDEHLNEDGTTTKTVKSSILLMKAAVALQEAMARIETLEQRVMALEA